jgi:hypothetical protein
MNKCILHAICYLFILFATGTGYAVDFFGASVTDKDTPSSFMKYGITGYRPVINEVDVASPAGNAGFNPGDIILSINNKNVRKSSELDKTSVGNLSVIVLTGNERRRLFIDKKTIEKANRLAAEARANNSPPSTSRDEGQENTSPVKFDDGYLEKRFGISTPSSREERDTQYRSSADAQNRRERAESLKSENRRNAEYAQKTNCTGIPGECGPGRSCVYDEIYYGGQKAITNGVCMSNSAADGEVSKRRDNENDRKSQIRERKRDRDIQTIKDKMNIL